jgi:XapX domain-containing protein
MRLYLLSLGAGLLVGVVYGLLGVRSPAPPVVALVGLLGILLGEQLVPVAPSMCWAACPATAPSRPTGAEPRPSTPPAPPPSHTEPRHGPSRPPRPDPA